MAQRSAGSKSSADSLNFSLASLMTSLIVSCRLFWHHSWLAWSLRTSLIVSCRLFWHHSWPAWSLMTSLIVSCRLFWHHSWPAWWRHLESAVSYFDITAGQFDDGTYCQLSAILTSQLASLMTSLIRQLSDILTSQITSLITFFIVSWHLTSPAHIWLFQLCTVLSQKQSESQA